MQDQKAVIRQRSVQVWYPLNPVFKLKSLTISKAQSKWFEVLNFVSTLALRITVGCAFNFDLYCWIRCWS